MQFTRLEGYRIQCDPKNIDFLNRAYAELISPTMRPAELVGELNVAARNTSLNALSFSLSLSDPSTEDGYVWLCGTQHFENGQPNKRIVTLFPQVRDLERAISIHTSEEIFAGRIELFVERFAEALKWVRGERGKHYTQEDIDAANRRYLEEVEEREREWAASAGRVIDG